MLPEFGLDYQSSSLLWEKQLCCRFSLAEIQAATQNFEEELIIGRGGFGKVYKGAISNEDGGTSVAAIKRLDFGSRQGAPEFWAEIEMLSKLRHCHLVSLIGYCNDEDEMILVYEYMPNGTLVDHLLKLGNQLSWVQRLKISVGAARGLDYLHTGTGTQHGVIHRDVKSSNILLDENLAAKISDFGLSKVGPTNQPSTNVSTAVKGTFGYLDPNYFSTGRLSRRSDVYAFGVVLFEVLSGRRAVDTSLDEEQWGLARWAQDCTRKGKLDQIVDSNLRNQVLPKCLKKFTQIAGRCLHKDPKQRPSMTKVVADLESTMAIQERHGKSNQPAAGIMTFSRKVQKFFTSQENFEREAQNAAWAATLMADEAEITRLRDIHTLNGKVKSVGKRRGIDILLDLIKFAAHGLSDKARGLILDKRTKQKNLGKEVEYAAKHSVNFESLEINMVTDRISSRRIDLLNEEAERLRTDFQALQVTLMTGRPNN